MHMVPGTNTVRAFVDCYGEIMESNKDNNQNVCLYLIKRWPANASPISDANLGLRAPLLGMYRAIASQEHETKLSIMQPLLDELIRQGRLHGVPDFRAMLDTDISIADMDISSRWTNDVQTLKADIRIRNEGYLALNLVPLGLWTDKPDPAVCGETPDYSHHLAVLPPRHEVRLSISNLPVRSSASICSFRAFVDPGCGIEDANRDNNQRLLTYAAGNKSVTRFKLSAVALSNQIVLRWTCPLACGMSDRKVRIRVCTDAYPMCKASGGTIIYEGTDTSYTHTPANLNRTYYYTLWVSDDGVNFFEPPER